MHTIHLESNLSHPLVVKTNENQWYEAEGLILDSMIFTTSVSEKNQFSSSIRLKFHGRNFATGYNEDI